jgi:hypothetical protein
MSHKLLQGKQLCFEKSMEKKELLSMDVNDEKEAENIHFGWVLNLQNNLTM